MAASNPTELSATHIFTEGRTAYRFTDTAIGDDQLQAIYDLAKYTPTSQNCQPLRVVFVRTDRAKARLLPLLAAKNRDYAATAPVSAILAADHSFHRHLAVLNPYKPDLGATLAADAPRRQAKAADNSWLQAGAFLLAVRAVGLDAGPLGGFDTAAVDAEFLADTDWHSFLVVNIGHVAAHGHRPRAPRHSFDEAARLL
ncbi:MAG TPA: malonic semialdehyde reductase [Propionibacteriaceae bacterium]|nr:malonic semialdehyde reductase [Propionibacteriaceae bacterium]